MGRVWVLESSGSRRRYEVDPIERLRFNRRQLCRWIRARAGLGSEAVSYVTVRPVVLTLDRRVKEVVTNPFQSIYSTLIFQRPVVAVTLCGGLGRSLYSHNLEFLSCLGFCTMTGVVTVVTVVGTSLVAITCAMSQWAEEKWPGCHLQRGKGT